MLIRNQIALKYIVSFYLTFDDPDLNKNIEVTVGDVVKIAYSDMKNRINRTAIGKIIEINVDRIKSKRLFSNVDNPIELYDDEVILKIDCSREYDSNTIEIMGRDIINIDKYPLDEDIKKDDDNTDAPENPDDKEPTTDPDKKDEEETSNPDKDKNDEKDNETDTPTNPTDDKNTEENPDQSEKDNTESETTETPNENKKEPTTDSEKDTESDKKDDSSSSSDTGENGTPSSSETPDDKEPTTDSDKKAEGEIKDENNDITKDETINKDTDVTTSNSNNTTTTDNAVDNG